MVAFLAKIVKVEVLLSELNYLPPVARQIALPREMQRVDLSWRTTPFVKKQFATYFPTLFMPRPTNAEGVMAAGPLRPQSNSMAATQAPGFPPC